MTKFFLSLRLKKSETMMRQNRVSLGKAIAHEIQNRGMTTNEVENLFLRCKTFECVYREIMQTEFDDGQLNCSYRYPYPPEQDPVSPYALWIDGPCTCVATLLSLVGAKYAIKFLCRAGLNRDMTAALFALCAIDSLLLIAVFLFYGIEAMSVLFLHSNIMYNKQAFTYKLHGVASSLTTSSTMLVIYITFLRFMVVVRPLRFATSIAQAHRRTGSKAVRKLSATMTNVEESQTIGSYSRGTFANSSMKRRFSVRQLIRPFYTPALLIILSFVVNIPIFLEFTIRSCFDVEHNEMASHPEATSFRTSFTSGYKAALMTLTQTIGPVSIILVLSILTEYRVHRSLKARKKLFESQQRSRSVVISEEIKERVSRTVAIFIAVKFLIFRTMPIFFDVYEMIYGIEGWGVTMSIMVRVSDFGIVLNTATNSLAYFGKQRWVEKRLRLLILKKEEKRNAAAKAVGNTSPTHLFKQCQTSSKNDGGGLPHPISVEKTPLVMQTKLINDDDDVYSEMV